MGNFPLFPQTGCPNDDIYRCEFPKTLRAVDRINGTVEAIPGYFAVSLNSSIHAEMTTTNHTALYRFNFPSKKTKNRRGESLPYSPLMLADLTDLSESRTDAQIKVDPDTGRITGNGTFKPSFGIGSYQLHFCADFKGADIRDSGVWINNRPGNSTNYLVVAEDGNNEEPPLTAGAWVRFKPPANDQLLARVGLSFFSTDQACRNAEKEIPNFDFAGVRKDAEEAWRTKLGVVSVDSKGVGESLKRIFWSGIYRSFISPQDYTGEQLHIPITFLYPSVALTVDSRGESSLEE